MADEISPIDKANGNSENSHNSENAADEESYDDSKDYDEPTERKRRKTDDNSVPTNQPMETDNEKESCDDQRSPIVLDVQQDQQIINTDAQPIETQTFWNSNYQNDSVISTMINPLSQMQEYPTTELIPSTSQGFSAFDMMEPEMEMIPLSLFEDNVQCPLCQVYFSPYQIEIHASTCMDE